MPQKERMIAVKLKQEFITHQTGGESLLVPTGNTAFSGLVRGNKTFGAILEQLKNDVTEAEIVAALKQRFDAPDGAVENDVKKALAELRRIGAIDG